MSDTGSLLTVRFEALGLEFTNITEWEIDSSYTTSADAFSFTLFDSDRSKVRFLELQPVELLVNGASQLLGRVDITNVGGNGSAVDCQGRDYIADMVECNVDPLAKVKAGDTVGNAFLHVASPVGIDTIFDDSDEDVIMRDIRAGVKIKTRGKGKKRKTKKLDEYKPKKGEGIYEYCNRLIARFGATIQPGPNRNSLVLSVPRYDQEPTYKLVRSADPTGSFNNNVIESSAARDYSRFPTLTIFNGWQPQADKRPAPSTTSFDILSLMLTGAQFGMPQSATDDFGRKRKEAGGADSQIQGAAPTVNNNAYLAAQANATKTKKPAGSTRKNEDSINSDAEFASFEEVQRILADSTISGRRKPDVQEDLGLAQLYRLLYFRDEEARTQEQIEHAARRAISDRLKSTLEYKCTVKGHIDPISGAVWSVDTIAQVEDEICGISEPLWIAERTLSYSSDAGAMTKMVMYRPGSFIFGD